MAEKYVKLDDIIETLEHEWGYEGMSEELEKLHAANVVEVVRCKECKWWHNEIDCRNTSGLYRFVPNGDWFCASGERRET